MLVQWSGYPQRSCCGGPRAGASGAGVSGSFRCWRIAKVWFVPSLLNEPLYVPALKKLLATLAQPLEVVPSTGMSAITVAPASA